MSAAGCSLPLQNNQPLGLRVQPTGRPAARRFPVLPRHHPPILHLVTPQLGGLRVEGLQDDDVVGDRHSVRDAEAYGGSTVAVEPSAADASPADSGRRLTEALLGSPSNVCSDSKTVCTEYAAVHFSFKISKHIFPK